MSQVKRDSYHLGGDYSAQEMEAREKIRETIVRLLTRIKSELTTHVMAPLAVTDPILFAELSADQWLDNFRESRRDREHLRDWLLEGLKQLVDAVDELKEFKLEDVPRQVSAWSKIRGTAWSVFTDLDVARGLIDVVNAASLRARNRTLDDRQADLDKRYAYIKGEIQRCIDSIRNQHPTAGPPAKRTKAPQSNASSRQPGTDWSALGGGGQKSAAVSIANLVTTGSHGPIGDQQAQQLFKDFKSNASIPFDYPVDCCYARANEMCRTAEARGIPCKKYWVFDQNWGTPDATSPLAPVRSDGSPVTFPNPYSNFQRTPVRWTYHVAPLIPVRHADGTVENMVFDPSISDRPLSEAQWRSVQGNPPNLIERTTPPNVFFINPRTNAATPDPNDTKTNDAFAKHRASRDAALDGERKSRP